MRQTDIGPIYCLKSTFAISENPRQLCVYFDNFLFLINCWLIQSSVSQTVCRGTLVRRGRFAAVPRVLLKCFCCYKFSAKSEKMLPLQATARKVIIFFFENQLHWGLHHVVG